MSTKIDLMSINSCCLLVNDDPYVQETFARALSVVSPSTLCFTTPTPADAFYMMIEENMIPDYIFIESDMPKMSGIKFLNVIKRIRVLKDIPVIVHTISPKPNEIIDLKESGALAICYRPYDFAGVCNMLNLYFGADILRIEQN
jgi:response regulator RpfG family c-di-GMP phosphodiesterase